MSGQAGVVSPDELSSIQPVPGQFEAGDSVISGRYRGGASVGSRQRAPAHRPEIAESPAGHVKKARREEKQFWCHTRASPARARSPVRGRE
jgi:hypothetical protein